MSNQPEQTVELPFLVCGRPRRQLALHFTDSQRSSPLYGQLICRASCLNCSPSPCHRLSLFPTTTGAPPPMGALGSHSLGIPPSPSPVHMMDLTMRGRLPVAVFTLACRTSSQTPRASYALHSAGWQHGYISPRHPIAAHTSAYYLSVNLLVSRVGGGDISTHRRALTGSCSSTVPHSASRRILA